MQDSGSTLDDEPTDDEPTQDDGPTYGSEVLRSLALSPVLDMLRAQQKRHAEMMKSLVRNPVAEMLREQQERRAEVMRSLVQPSVIQAIRDQQERAEVMTSLVRTPVAEMLREQQDRQAAVMRSLVQPSVMQMIQAQQERRAEVFQSLAGTSMLSALEAVAGKLRRVAGAAARVAVEIWPANLRGIEGLTFEKLEVVLMEEGIALSGVPRKSIAQALIEAGSASKRRAILGRRWRAIADDCEALMRSCESSRVAADRDFALKSIAALKAGHDEAAQALAANLLDTMMAKHFKAERVVLVPSKKVRTPDGYGEFVLDKYWALAPIWMAYKNFFPGRGDPVPRSFARHASAHAVSQKQFSRRNAVQAVMLVTSLVGYLDRNPSGDL